MWKIGNCPINITILDAERSSLLYCKRNSNDSKINFPTLENTWYDQFFQLLSENCVKGDLKERFKSITLIIFNYDRCIEHFIYYALQNYYRLAEVEAAELVKNITIYHPYGDVGTLPWVNQNGAIEFGAEPHSNELLELSQKIKTFTEGTDPKASEILEIREQMSIANKVIFLGFAFHKLNMQLITPEHDKNRNNSGVKCFATTYGISDSDKEVIEQQIKELYLGVIRVIASNLSSVVFLQNIGEVCLFEINIARACRAQ